MGPTELLVTQGSNILMAHRLLWARLGLFLLAVGLLASVPGLAAQSLTAGGVRGAVRATDGSPVAGAQVTLEAIDGSAVQTVEADALGEFAIGLLGPGSYRILAEQIGFQPVRRLGIMVSAGRTTTVALTLERRPPPITSVTELDLPAGPAGGSLSRIIAAEELGSLDFGRDLASASRGTSVVVVPSLGGSGFAAAASGRDATTSRLYVDGVPEPLWRHPGIPGLAPFTPLYLRRGLDQAQIIAVPTDAEWRGAGGVSLDAQSRRGTNKLRFEPYLAGSSAALGGLKALNPGDSSATSFDGGFVVSGALVPDTAHFVIRGDFRSLQTPSAMPWTHDEATYRGSPVSIAAVLGQIAADSFGTQIGASTAPVVRTSKGGSGSGNVNWRLSPKNIVGARFGFATWKETSPDLGLDAGNEAGLRHEGRDISGALTLTTVSGTLANEARVGISVSKRDWLTAGGPATVLVGEGIRFGGIGGLPAAFERRTFTLSDAFQVTKGRHRVKFGGNVDATSHDQEYRYGSSGIYTFGSLDEFGAGRGFFFVTTGAELAAQFRTTDAGVFVQDAWRVTPEIELLLGLRYDLQKLPVGAVAANARWLELSGLRNDSVPSTKGAASPRFAFTWDVRNQGTWVIEGAAGVHFTGLDPALFGEMIQTASGLRARRGVGVFSNWPNLPQPSLVPDGGARLTLLSPTYRAPKSFKSGLGLRGQVGSGVTLRLAGSYNHADYLPRRIDLNRASGTLAVTQEGRPVYGTLVKQGGLVAPNPGSNRRFTEFDLVSALAPTGFSDHYEFTAALERQVSRSLSLLASYTYSKTEDNLVGLLAVDPADQLSPFPEGLAGADWDRGRSDLDVPHRFAATAEYRSEGRTPIALLARYRWRSGLPFTPGLRYGVDLNGDGGGGNDPAFVDAGVGNVQQALSAASCQVALNAFAARNSCRAEAVQGLDLGLRIGVPFGALGSRLVVTVDAFNVISSEIGVVDRALFLVDPAGALGNTSSRTVTVPLIANGNFGTLASRRGEPRLVRIGLGIEY